MVIFDSYVTVYQRVVRIDSHDLEMWKNGGRDCEVIQEMNQSQSQKNRKVGTSGKPTFRH